MISNEEKQRRSSPKTSTCGVAYFLVFIFFINVFVASSVLDFPCLTSIFYIQRICIAPEESVELSITTRCQGNDLWRSERNLRITASECYKLFTANKNPATVWPSKIAMYYRIQPDRQCFKIGRREEKNAIALYEKEKKTKVAKVGLVVPPTCPWLGCSSDGFVFETKTLVK